MAICDQVHQSEDSFFGHKIVNQLKAQLLTPDPDTGRAHLLGQLGHELLRLGRQQEAIVSFEEALAIVGDTPARKRLRLQLRRYLALAFMFDAEDRNCVFRHSPTSCTLPIEPSAVHIDRAPIQQARRHLRSYLDESPYDIQARWLFNLAHSLAGEDPLNIPQRWRLPPDALLSDAPMPRWTNIAAALGVDSFDLAGGAVMDDFDGDGLLDLISSTWDPCGSMKAYRNNGRGGFTNVTAAWGLEAQLGGLNLIHADYDNDGRLDLFVLRGAWRKKRGEVRNSLLRNEIGMGRDRFVDVTVSAGLTGAYPTQTAAWADYDGDGDLDLYIGNEANDDGPYPSQLFRNEGQAANGYSFRDVAVQAGVTNQGYAKGVTWGDYNEDGAPDLYVSNIGANRLYVNQGADSRGVVTFVDKAAEAGVTGPEKASFASWFFDFDNDGDLDLLVADYQIETKWVSASYLGLSSTEGHPVLYQNQGGDPDGRFLFTDISEKVGLKRPLLPMGANYGDLDNDGFLDVYFGTGLPDLESLMPNVMYRNGVGSEQGARIFLDVSSSGGFAHLQKGHAIAFGDLDNDGDQDIFQQLGGAFPVDAFFNALYENPGNGAEPNKGWISLDLEGKQANRFGIGARIEVRLRRGEVRRSIHVLVSAGGSFGASSLRQEIGLGAADEIETLIVRWPGSGTVEFFHGVPMRRHYRVIEGHGKLIPRDLPILELGLEETNPTAAEKNPLEI